MTASPSHSPRTQGQSPGD